MNIPTTTKVFARKMKFSKKEKNRKKWNFPKKEKKILVIYMLFCYTTIPHEFVRFLQETLT